MTDPKASSGAPSGAGAASGAPSTGGAASGAAVSLSEDEDEGPGSFAGAVLPAVGESAALPAEA